MVACGRSRKKGVHVKRPMMLHASEAGEADEGCPTDVSAEAALHREIAKLSDWLAAQGLNPHGDRDHAHESSRERLYWRYGYFMGLKQALALLTNRGETVH